MDLRTCHCGKQFENTRYKGGPRKHGRHQKHCSPRCVAIATKCRFYGVDPKEFWKLHARGCGICGHQWKKGERQLAIDHEHVPGFHGLHHDQKRKYVRGLLCILCNKHRMGAVDLDIARRMVAYLEAYHGS